IDDYSISEPIPAEMLATLNQMRVFDEASPEDESAVADVPESAETAGNCDILTGERQNVPVVPSAEMAGHGDQ
ncbi:MAG: hypothetical protein Q8N17_03500, partial [Burkholderiaceae bacterium]|nr:hypothetical protein [Burkholderiaceae bacterium]